jgi:hypothetical protein
MRGFSQGDGARRIRHARLRNWIGTTRFERRRLRPLKARPALPKALVLAHPAGRSPPLLPRQPRRACLQPNVVHRAVRKACNALLVQFSSRPFSVQRTSWSLHGGPLIDFTLSLWCSMSGYEPRCLIATWLHTAASFPPPAGVVTCWRSTNQERPRSFRSMPEAANAALKAYRGHRHYLSRQHRPRSHSSGTGGGARCCSTGRIA